MRQSLELIRKIEKRKRDGHSRFLKDLSTRHIPRLFSEIGILEYKVTHKFIEPVGPSWQREVSPDLIVAYNNDNLNILMVEAKAKMSRLGSFKLKEQLAYLRHFVDSPSGAESLYYLLEEKIPLQKLECCGIITAGVYATKQRGFKIYAQETLR